MPHFEVIKRTDSRDVDGVDMGGANGKVHFNGRTTARITDPALAKDIQQSIGQDSRRDCPVLVAEVPDRGKKITSTGFGPGKWDEIREQQAKERDNK